MYKWIYLQPKGEKSKPEYPEKKKKPRRVSIILLFEANSYFCCTDTDRTFLLFGPTFAFSWGFL